MEKIINKNYGSIPHLSTSKLTQQADKKIEYNQELILTKKTRDWKDLIIVTEKLDGCNMGIIRIDNELISITRSGYRAENSKYEHHRLFHYWVLKNISKYCIPPEIRVVGEWMIKPHGTLYDLTAEPYFLVFDIFKKNIRLPFLEFYKFCVLNGLPFVPILHIGNAISIKTARKLLGNGHYGNPEKPEGFVMRCERDGNVDFIAKWVREDKDDGKYMNDNIYNKGFDL